MKDKNITKEGVIRGYILDKSEGLFIRKGFEQTSMDMIARASELSKPTLYNYFPCKNDLFMDLHVRIHERINDTILEHLKKDGAPFAVLQEIVDSAVRISLEHRDFLRVFNREYHHLTHENLSEHIEWSLTNRNTMARVFRRFLEGKVRADAKERFDVESLAAFILSMFDTLFFELAVNDSERIETFKELFFYILKNGVLA